MGNPPVHDPADDAVPAGSSTNGVLSWIGAGAISEGAARLPQAGPEQEHQPRRSVVLTALERFGAVRVTYRLASYRHGRSRHWHWCAVHADPIVIPLPVRTVRWLDDYWWPGRVERA